MYLNKRSNTNKNMKNNHLIIISFLNFLVHINCNSQTMTINNPSILNKKIIKWEVNEKAHNSNVEIILQEPDRPIEKKSPEQLEQITIWNPFEDKKVKIVFKASSTSNDWKDITSNKTYTLQSNKEASYTIYTSTAVCTGELVQSTSYEIYSVNGKFCIRKK